MNSKVDVKDDNLSLDEITKREIVAILTVGGSRLTAAKYVKCTLETIRYNAEQDDEFANQIRKAEATLEVVQLKNIENSGKRDWRASAWLLERKYPEKFGTRKIADISRRKLAELLNHFTEIIISEVPVMKYRKKILKRFEDLCGQLGDDLR